MKSTITSKYQTTVPKYVRDNLGIEVHDALEWRIERGRAVVIPIHNSFLQYRNAVKTGAGDIRTDIEQARELRVEKYR